MKFNFPLPHQYIIRSKFIEYILNLWFSSLTTIFIAGGLYLNCTGNYVAEIKVKSVTDHQ